MPSAEETRKLRDEEIAIELKKVREKLFTLRTQMVTDKVDDTSQFRKLRRDVARLLTESRARENARS
jgi:large subunit ribosomal protein L29